MNRRIEQPADPSLPRPVKDLVAEGGNVLSTDDSLACGADEAANAGLAAGLRRKSKKASGATHSEADVPARRPHGKA